MDLWKNDGGEDADEKNNSATEGAKLPPKYLHKSLESHRMLCGGKQQINDLLCFLLLC